MKVDIMIVNFIRDVNIVTFPGIVQENKFIGKCIGSDNDYNIISINKSKPLLQIC